MKSKKKLKRDKVIPKEDLDRFGLDCDSLIDIPRKNMLALLSDQINFQTSPCLIIICCKISFYLKMK